MLESFKAASWKARILNLSLWILYFACLSGCGIAYLGVLQEGNERDNNHTWQFYYNGWGILETGEFTSYSSDPSQSDADHTCNSGGKALLALELITMFLLVPAWFLSTVRIVGVHISKLQPPVKWLNLEFYLAVIATFTQFLSCIAWGVSCYHSSTQIAALNEMVPTGFIWLILCDVFLFAICGIYIVLRSDPALILGSVYGGELSGTMGNDPMTTSEVESQAA